MKDLLIMIVEYLFHVDSDEEITLKLLAEIILKIIIFILVLTLILWLLLKGN